MLRLIIFLHKLLKLIPSASASLGSKLVGVIPGDTIRFNEINFIIGIDNEIRP